jgi:hypothetical protein
VQLLLKFKYGFNDAMVLIFIKQMYFV